MQSLRDRWNRFANSWAGTPHYFTLTSGHLSLTRALLPFIERHAAGRMLDAGAGYGAFRGVLHQRGQSYCGLDLHLGAGAVDVLADGREMPFAANTFDTVLCSQVIEHTPEPWRLLKYTCRVLRPGGVLILSAPHLSYVHAIPNDFYRFTSFGLTFLLQQAGFKVETVVPAGGLLSLVGSLLPTLYLALLPPRPSRLARGIMFVNRAISHLIVKIDSWLDRSKLLALNFVAVARKPPETQTTSG